MNFNVLITVSAFSYLVISVRMCVCVCASSYMIKGHECVILKVKRSCEKVKLLKILICIEKFFKLNFIDCLKLNACTRSLSLSIFLFRLNVQRNFIQALKVEGEILDSNANFLI